MSIGTPTLSPELQDLMWSGMQQAVDDALTAGLGAMECPAPMTLSEWADENFYLSAESSYVEGPWETLPFQKGIMDSMSNDDIRVVVFKKSARVGYTKMLMTAVGYFAEHKKRNQAVWQPIEDDRDSFTKTEINPMLRDVECMRRIFPYADKKSKNNTLELKGFIGSTLHIRPGKSAVNYRRITVDVAYLDELDGFDTDIDREGDPVTLASKRVEGSIFPKVIMGSTPKIKNESMIEHQADIAELKMRYVIPCPHCSERIPLEWGGKDAQVGFKWVNDDPDSVAHLCGCCGALFNQAEYLSAYEEGRWQADSGEWIDPDGQFRNAEDEVIRPPVSIAFELWTAYSPMTAWSQIVTEFLAAKSNPSKLKTFVNTTLGETWEEDEGEQLEKDTLYRRREHYRGKVPSWVMYLTAGIDTQDDRFEVQVDGWGIGEERAGIAYQRLYGDPSRPQLWSTLADYLRRQYRREDGVLQGLTLACQDHGGHYSKEVNDFSKKMGIRFLIPVKGSSVYGKPIVTFPRKRNDNGVYLTTVGTDTGKDLMFQRLNIFDPGPGYWHFPVSDDFDEEYFKQLTAEERVPKWTQGKKRYVWDAKKRRQEPWDCSLYSLVAIRIMQQHMGYQLEVPSVPEDKTPVSNEAAKSGTRDDSGFGSEDWQL